MGAELSELPPVAAPNAFGNIFSDIQLLLLIGQACAGMSCC